MRNILLASLIALAACAGPKTETPVDTDTVDSDTVVDTLVVDSDSDTESDSDTDVAATAAIVNTAVQAAGVEVGKPGYIINRVESASVTK